MNEHETHTGLRINLRHKRTNYTIHQTEEELNNLLKTAYTAVAKN